MKILPKIIRYLLRYQIFISYSTKNIRSLNSITTILENYGVVVDSAPRDAPPMKSWRENIKLKIRNSHLFIVLASQSALRKKIIHQETIIADTLKIPYLILTLPDVNDLSDKSFGLVEVTQYIKWDDSKRDEKIKKIMNKGFLNRGIFYLILIAIIIFIILDKIKNS